MMSAFVVPQQILNIQGPSHGAVEGLRQVHFEAGPRNCLCCLHSVMGSTQWANPESPLEEPGCKQTCIARHAASKGDKIITRAQQCSDVKPTPPETQLFYWEPMVGKWHA